MIGASQTCHYICLSTKLSDVLFCPPSTDPGYGEYHSLDVNHLEICKPPSQRSLLYQLTLRFILHSTPRSLPHMLSERLREDLDAEDSAEVFYPLGMSFGE